jgi:hypothetical protein
MFLLRTGNPRSENKEETATPSRNCDGLKVTSARRSIVSGLSGGSGRSLWAWITLLTLRSRRTGRTNRTPIASGAGGPVGSRVASLTFGAWWTL